MLQSPSRPWAVRGATFLLWGAAAASVAFWGLRMGESSRPANPPPADASPAPPVDPAAVARLLGSGPAGAAPTAEPSVASRLRLVGVAAGRDSGGGAALISIDGKPARPFRVGAKIDEGLVLDHVSGRQARVAVAAGGVITLDMPALRR